MTSDFELRSCQGKVSYRSGPAAAKARDRMSKKHLNCRSKGNQRSRAKTAIYKCGFCHLFHLGRPMRAK